MEKTDPENLGKEEKMKKIIAFSILLAISLSLVFSVSAGASFGSGVAVSSSDVKVIKTALFGKKLTFSDLDIKQALCIDDFKEIKITKIPPSNEGALMLGGRRVTDGVSIKRKNLPALVFIPASKDVECSSFNFTVDDYLDGAEIEFLIRFTDKINYEPEIAKDETTSLTLSTQREIGVYSRMKATDKEGDKLEYMILSYPKGTLQVLDKESGEYLYTPPYSFVGSDSFTYVCRDEWGNFSTPCEVTVNVGERMSEVVYYDMENRPEYSASVAMSAMGIMGGELIGDAMYFHPDKEVTRAEFVSMAMKVVGMKSDTKLSQTFFDDNSDIPIPLVSYVATAQKKGIIHGTFKDGKLIFNPNEAITKYEAGLIMASLINKEVEGEVPVFNDTSSIPSYAKDAIYTMCSLGIFEIVDGNINPTASVTRGECAEYLYRLYKAK